MARHRKKQQQQDEKMKKQTSKKTTNWLFKKNDFIWFSGFKFKVIGIKSSFIDVLKMKKKKQHKQTN